MLLLQKERLLPELLSFGCDVSPNDVQYPEKHVYKQKLRTQHLEHISNFVRRFQ